MSPDVSKSDTPRRCVQFPALRVYTWEPVREGVWGFQHSTHNHCSIPCVPTENMVLVISQTRGPLCSPENKPLVFCWGRGKTPIWETGSGGRTASSAACLQILLLSAFLEPPISLTCITFPSTFQLPKYCSYCLFPCHLCPCGFVYFTDSFIDALEECEEGSGVIYIFIHQLYLFSYLEECFVWSDEHFGWKRLATSNSRAPGHSYRWGHCQGEAELPSITLRRILNCWREVWD